MFSRKTKESNVNQHHVLNGNHKTKKDQDNLNKEEFSKDSHPTNGR